MTTYEYQMDGSVFSTSLVGKAVELIFVSCSFIRILVLVIYLSLYAYTACRGVAIYTFSGNLCNSSVIRQHYASRHGTDSSREHGDSIHTLCLSS